MLQHVNETYTNRSFYNGADNSHILLQKVLFATALSALRARRKCAESFDRHGLIGNEILNDIGRLLKLFQGKDKFDIDTMFTIMEILEELQDEIKQSTYFEDEFVAENKVILKTRDAVYIDQCDVIYIDKWIILM